MKSLTTAATAGLLAAVLGLTVAGCSTATETRTAEETSAAQAAATDADADAVDRVTLRRPWVAMQAHLPSPSTAMRGRSSTARCTL